MIADTAKTVIDLFCGAGGLSEGFRQAGFHVLAGQDYDDMAGRTFSATHHEARFIGGADRAGDAATVAGCGRQEAW